MPTLNELRKFIDAGETAKGDSDWVAEMVQNIEGTYLYENDEGNAKYETWEALIDAVGGIRDDWDMESTSIISSGIQLREPGYGLYGVVAQLCDGELRLWRGRKVRTGIHDDKDGFPVEDYEIQSEVGVDLAGDETLMLVKWLLKNEELLKASAEMNEEDVDLCPRCGKHHIAALVDFCTE